MLRAEVTGTPAGTEHLVSPQVCPEPAAASLAPGFTLECWGTTRTSARGDGEDSWEREAPMLGLGFSSFPLSSRLFPQTPSSWWRGAVPGHPSSLTLGFDIIHHRAGGLHDHVTGPGASSCVVHTPQGEPGREGRVSLSENSQALPGSEAGGGEGSCPRMLCDSMMHLLPPPRSQDVWSQASHCFLVGLGLGFAVLGILSDGKHHSIEHWLLKWGPQTCSSSVMPHPDLLDGDSRDGAQAILTPVTF